MQGRLFLNVVIGERSAIFQLFARKDEPLLVGWNALFVLNFLFNVLDGIRRLHIESDGLPSECLHKYLHPLMSTDIILYIDNHVTRVMCITNKFKNE